MSLPHHAESGPGSERALERTRVLVVDDDPNQLELTKRILETEAIFAVATAETGEAALEAVGEDLPDAVVLDVRLPGMGGVETLKAIKARSPELPVIMLTGHADVETAVEAIRAGAYHFLIKPVESAELVLILRRALERHQMLAELEELRRRASEGGALGLLAGASEGARNLVRQIRQVAASRFTVLIQGETGAGKEVVARAIHEESPRRDQPLIAVDCGAIPENLLESELFGYERGAFTGADRRKDGFFHAARGGTLFLDEIANLRAPLQSKLLRVLQEREVRPLGACDAQPTDVRVVAATNASLDHEIRGGQFRQDLYYRLAEFTILLPPLRDRREEIPSLARRFREEASLELRRPVGAIAEDAMALMLAHAWPGNVRELRNVVRRAVLLADDFVIRSAEVRAVLGAAAEPSVLDEATPSEGLTLKQITDRAVEEAERRAIRHALRAAGGNKTRAARLLQVDFKTLHLKMKRYGVSAHQN